MCLVFLAARENVDVEVREVLVPGGGSLVFAHALQDRPVTWEGFLLG